MVHDRPGGKRAAMSEHERSGQREVAASDSRPERDGSSTEFLGRTAPADLVARLQRTVGNRAVARLIGHPRPQPLRRLMRQTYAPVVSQERGEASYRLLGFDRKLDWADYPEAPDNAAKFDAQTDAQIAVRFGPRKLPDRPVFNAVGGKYQLTNQIEVEVYFRPSNSWKRSDRIDSFKAG